MAQSENDPNTLTSGSPWTQEEDSLLQEHYPTLTAEQIRFRYLPHRSVKAIRVRACKQNLTGMKVSSFQWSSDELLILLLVYPDGGVDGCKSLLPNRYRHNIREMAKVLNLQCKHGPRSSSYTDEELDIIEMYYPDNGTAVCKAFLPHRTGQSINRAARAIKVSRKKELCSKNLRPRDWDFVMNKVHHLGFFRCAEPLGETPERLRELCDAAGIDCNAIDLAFMGRESFKGGPYSVEEKDYIRRNFYSLGALRIAYKTCRSPKALAQYARLRLGLTKKSGASQPAFTNLEHVINGRDDIGYKFSPNKTPPSQWIPAT
jgi:hypothetical protein